MDSRAGGLLSLSTSPVFVGGLVGNVPGNVGEDWDPGLQRGWSLRTSPGPVSKETVLP